MANYDTTIANSYVTNPRDLSKYTAYRGVTDFSQIGQFNQYESGYQWLFIIQMPKFMTKLASLAGDNSALSNIVNGFRHTIEYEFRGLDGLPDITTDTFEITDGINTQRMINKVTEETSVEVSSSYFEKHGSTITKFSQIYISGIKDPKSQAKTYHGLIKHGQMAPGLENEVFTMMYIVTDNTYYNIEKAYLLANGQLNKVENIYNGSRDNIGNKEISVPWNCFPISGLDVDKAAKTLLESVTGVHVEHSGYSKDNYKLGQQKIKTISINGVTETKAEIDSNNYHYAILKEKNADKNPEGNNQFASWVAAQDGK